MLSNDVLDRLLLSRSLIERFRYQPVADRHTIAAHVLAAHDAAELAIAALCSHKGASVKDRATFMDYFEPLAAATDSTIKGKNYFSQLNTVRRDFKHQGITPDKDTWKYVTENTFSYIEIWCEEYLGVPFSSLDQSLLIKDPEVYSLYLSAWKFHDSESYKEALEKIASALDRVLRSQSAFRSIAVGRPKSEDAIFVMGLGISGPVFLALQEFLPEIGTYGPSKGNYIWKQSEFGHPGNWSSSRVRHCFKMFLDIAIRMQDAEWVLRPTERYLLFEFDVSPRNQDVLLTHEVPDLSPHPGQVFVPIFTPTKLEPYTTLKVGTSIQPQSVKLKTSTAEQLLSGKRRIVMTGLVESEPWKEVYAPFDEVQVLCVPRKVDWVQEHYPHLTPIEWDPD